MNELFKYVALGDSSGVGVGADHDGGYPERLFRRMKAHGIPIGILNLARSGATSRAVLDEQVARAAAKAPALVTLGVGINDLWRMVPVETFEDHLEQISRQLAGCRAQVVVSTMPDMSLAPIAEVAEALIQLSRETLVRRLDQLNDVLATVARRHQFQLVDMFTVSRRELPDHPEYFHVDGFHPSSAGYDRLAELLWPTILPIAEEWAARLPRTGSSD